MRLPRLWAILAVFLVIVTALFGAPADYPPALHTALVCLAVGVGLLLTWLAGARVIFRGHADDTERLRATSATLLIAPFILFGLAPGIGPPRVQQPQDNELRFLLLAIDAMLVGAALIVLKEGLSSAGERFYASAGWAAIVMATPLYVAFALIQRVDYVAVELNWSWAGAVSGDLHELTALDAFSMAALFFAGALTYVATAAFAASLARVGWLGRGTAIALQLLSGLGLAFLIARGFAYPSLAAAFSHWYTVPGFVAGIPAVPWMPLCAIGVLLLRRIGREREASMGTLNVPVRPAAG